MVGEGGNREKRDNDESIQDYLFFNDETFLVMDNFRNGLDDINDGEKYKKYPTQHCNICFMFLRSCWNICLCFRRSRRTQQF